MDLEHVAAEVFALVQVMKSKYLFLIATLVFCYHHLCEESQCLLLSDQLGSQI